ncbi:SH3 domain-containing protein [Siminovitchia fortis]|uniref:SH3 domain-containing protein n=1 Tax=Siminovitchia fortis TaxID=254758 RepID=UPI0024C0EF4B|nr:SH3 domain-containing protein [Siminovitchia fortis]WHY81039.1 SH3 domain-containing protein [Siminovitchia fortis]
MKRTLFLALLAIGLVFTPFGNAAGAQSVKKVIVDAGHGGSDTGATGNGLREKDLTLKIAQKVNKNLVNNYTVNTKMTRTSDVYISLKQRTNIANSWGADLFLSIHINAAGGSGYEDYIHNRNATSEDIKVQNEVNKEISKVLAEYGKNNRGKKKANFHVLRESKMASILLEILFIDNKSDAALLKNEKFLNDMSKAISTGVANALALPEKGNSATGTSNTNTSAKEKITVSKATGTYIVTADSLNVRTGDGTNYPTIGSLKKNAQVKVTGKTSKGWYQFSFKGKTGYVSGAYLKVKPAAAKPAPKPQNNQIKVSKASGTYIVTANSLNVRSGNSTKFSSLGSLKKNSQVTVTGKTSNNWYQFKFKGKTGYVSGAYLKAKPVAAKPAAKKPAPAAKNNQIKITKASGTYIVTANSLNVRSGNSTKFSSLGSLKKNNQVTVTGKTSDNWYQFKFKGKTGYVSGAYLKAKPAQSAKAKSTKSIKVTKASGTYRVTASKLNVRSGNTASHSRIGSLARGNKVKVTGKTSNGWYRINLKGKVGFVSGQYLKR